MKERFRVQFMDGSWSDWFDKNTDINHLKGEDIAAIHTEQFMTKEQYEEYKNEIDGTSS